MGALGPLLGSSWASLGHPWGPKMVPKRAGEIEPRQFFFNLNLHHLFFSIFAASWCLWGLSWEGFGPSGASLGRVFDPLGTHFSRISAKIVWIFGLLAPLCVYLLWLTRHMVPCKLLHQFCPFNPLTNTSNVSNNLAWRNARSD